MLGTNSPTAGPRQIVSDFFGKVTTGLAEGISRIGSDVMPIWAASQMKLQAEDQLFQEMYDPAGKGAQPSVQKAGEIAASPIEKVWFDIKGLQITGGNLIVIGGIFIAAIFLFKKKVI